MGCACVHPGGRLQLPNDGRQAARAGLLCFQCCQPANCRPVPLCAVQRWAGPDQAQALSLCEWLYHRVEPLRAFMAQEGTQEEGAATGVAAWMQCRRWFGLLLSAIAACWLGGGCIELNPGCPRTSQLLPAAGRQQRSEGVLQALAAVAEAVRGWEFCQKYGAWVEAHQGQLAPTVVEFWQQAQQVG